MIEVCCAIILRGSKMLAVQHGPESRHLGKWEFPGGKIQLGETAEQCVIREIDEELQIRIDVLRPLEFIEFHDNGSQIRLIPFICKIISGDVALTEHMDECWFDMDTWQTINWLDADRELILKNQENIRLWVDSNAL